MRARPILFDSTGYRGRTFPLMDAAATLGTFGNRAGSVQVYGGRWQLCDGTGFRGRCVEVTDSISDLGRLGMRDSA